MKRFMLIACGLLLAACSESSDQASPTDPTARFASGGIVTPAADITIDPSGDLSGVTDADAIEQALITSGPGDIIELTAGTFYVGRTLIAPAGFGGTLRGAGKDETTIMGVGTGSAPFGNALINFPGGPGLVDGSAFFFFPQPSGHIAVSDLAILLPDNFVTEPDPFGGTDLTAFVVVQLGAEDCNTSFTDLRLRGTATTNTFLPWFLDQPLWGIGVTGWDVAFPSFSSGGNHAVKGSEISRVGLQALVHQIFRGASIAIADNTLTDVKQVITRWLDGANVSITGNTMDTYSWGAMVVTQEGVPVVGDLSNVLIRGNDVSTKGYAGIEIGWIPPDTRPDFNLLIEKNNVFKAGPDPIGMFPNVTGIVLDGGQDGAMVRNNIIRGDGFAGIAMFAVTNSAFIGNNVQGFAPRDADYVLFGDPFSDSNDNTIVGVGKGTVWDFGSGNIITGLTRGQGDESVGERIKAAQEKRRELLAAIGGTY